MTSVSDGKTPEASGTAVAEAVLDGQTVTASENVAQVKTFVRVLLLKASPPASLGLCRIGVGTQDGFPVEICVALPRASPSAFMAGLGLWLLGLGQVLRLGL
jgi:hypothetical protein